MFESITIKSKEISKLKLDVGFLAECLLFYKQINLLADKNSLPELFSLCGIDEVKELIKRGRLSLFIREDIIGASIFRENLYGYQTWTSESTKQEKILFDSLSKLVDDEKAKVLTKEFLDLTKPFKYKEGIHDEIKSDLLDKPYLSRAIATSINHWNPENKINANEIEASFTDAGNFGSFEAHKFDINIDLNKYKDVSAASIILNVAEARGNIHIASHFNSEIADKQIYSCLIQDRVNTLIDKHQRNQNGIESFQEIILQDYKPISTVLRNKEKTFDEFLEILDKADKFREWLAKAEEDKNIVAEYHKAVTSETWIDKLPSKSVRFALFTGLGLVLDAALTGGIGTVVGVAMGAGDTFVLDKLLKGWKPNQFIDEDLKEFLPEKK